jgi:hypothetical protein
VSWGSLFPIAVYIILAIITMNYIRYKLPDVRETAEMKAKLIRNYRRYIFTMIIIWSVIGVGWVITNNATGDDC